MRGGKRASAAQKQAAAAAEALRGGVDETLAKYGLHNRDAALGSGWLPLGGIAIVARCVPVGAPLMHVGRYTEKAVWVGLTEGDGPRPLQRPASTIGNPRGDR